MKTSPVALLLSLGIAGCASTADLSKEPLRISVSAADYSQISGTELYKRVNAPDNAHPEPPVLSEPSQPLFYAFVPVDYTPAVPLETILRELATPLANRGYFNVIYQIKAGYPPKRIDYLLRIYCGRQYWRTPTVRTDKVTWGNSGLVSSTGARSATTAHVIGKESEWDPHAGSTPLEIASLAMNFQQGQGGMMGGQGSMGGGMGAGMGGGWGSYSAGQMTGYRDLSRDSGSVFSWLILIEAFKFEDVRVKMADAPCIWAALAAAPDRPGLDPVKAIRTVTRVAMPYFGTTTDGLQIFEVPPGKVLVGESVKAP